MAGIKARLAAARAALAKRRRGGGGGGMFGGGMVKTVGMGAGTGAAAQFVGEMARGSGDPTKGVGFMRDNWYGEPGALLVGGILLSKRRPMLAHSLLGAAGYAGAFFYKINQFQLGKGKNPVPNFAQGSAKGGAAPAAQGDYDAGEQINPANAF